MKPEEISFLQVCLWIGVFIMVIGGSLTIAVHIKNLFFSKTPTTPQPFETKKATEYVERREFEELKANSKEELSKLTKQMEKRFDDLTAERRESLKNLHAHITSSCTGIKDEICEMDKRYEERLRDGNHMMIEHGNKISALQAMNKGGRA